MSLRKSSAARACMRAGISSEKSSSKRSGMELAHALFPLPLVGRGRGGGREDSALNQLKHALDIGQHIDVPKSQYAIALRLEKFGSSRVAFHLLRVLSAVDFDDDVQIMAGEIDDVAAKTHLPPKVRGWQRDAMA